MFTGIVEETGVVVQFVEGPQAWKLTVSADKIIEQLETGDSVAVNGCCLSAVKFDSGTVTFDLLGETVQRTSFASLEEKAAVNLERSLCFDGKIGGHFLTGHIDAAAEIAVLELWDKDYYLRVEPPREYLRYVVSKGCIAVDGVSLTVAEVDDTGFAVWLIPITMEVTNFHQRKPGDLVNLEFDLLAKYVEKLLPGDRK